MANKPDVFNMKKKVQKAFKDQATEEKAQSKKTYRLGKRKGRMPAAGEEAQFKKDWGTHMGGMGKMKPSASLRKDMMDKRYKHVVDVIEKSERKKSGKK